MITKVVIVVHPECDAPFELGSSPWLAFVKTLKPLEKKVRGRRMVLATSEDYIQRFAKKISVHLGVDITVCDCLMNKGDFDCVDDYVTDGIEFLVVIAADDVAEALVAYLKVAIGRNPTYTHTIEMRPVQVYTF